ncbi:MAG: hypothetical protein C7B45_16140 [Sulfobacillus acidophilus]|uniref:DUF4351 domain-containing protein n=1 Tax=Sulfobacillus acidophilus TaxID=53633 RepID=A0A2T2WD56_9FIRM|nr:MAG: hypothetical protein C7B45_16140 [Sulfobacillus acidophilus]
MDIQVPRTAKDYVQKLMADVFEKTLVNWYGLGETRVVGSVPSEIPQIVIQNSLLDHVFVTDKGHLLHIEFQSTTEPDLYRFLSYATALTVAHRRSVRSIVVYLCAISSAPALLNAGAIQYSVENVFIAEKSGESAWDRVSRLPVDAWTDSDILDLTFYPFMRDAQSQSERALKAAKLSTQLPKAMQQRVGAMLLGLTLSFLDDAVVQSIKEVIRVNDLIRELEEEAIQRGWNKGWQEGHQRGHEQGRAEGRAEGLAEGLAEGRVEGREEGLWQGEWSMVQMQLQARLGMIPDSLMNQVRKLNRQQLLKLGCQLLSIGTIDELSAVVTKLASDPMH